MKYVLLFKAVTNSMVTTTTNYLNCSAAPTRLYFCTT